MTWRRPWSLLGASLLGALLLTGCGSPSSPRPVTGAAASPVVGTGDLLAYRLGSGDRVRLTVFRHPDLSGEFVVDGQGKLALPLVGEISAGDLSVRELEERVGVSLRQGFLVDPQVSVEVLNYRPFYILGEVRSPGGYPFVSGMTVLNAVALAGGYTYRARVGGVTITRGGANGATLGAASDSAILPGDVIEVPERFF